MNQPKNAFACIRKSRMDSALSCFFAFTILQIQIILFMYLSISYLIGKQALITTGMACNIASMILMSISALMKITLLAMIMDRCHVALIGIAISLKEAKKNIVVPNEVANIKILIEKIRSVSPFNGGGFFDVDKKTVTSMVGSTVSLSPILLYSYSLKR